MIHSPDIPLIHTIKERCRVCYTCVRECPAKAIRIADGQAEVIPQRCIGCGNCVRVCSQNAKEVLNSTGLVRELLQAPVKTAACLAPSFPAEFADINWRRMIGMIRKLGFDIVSEVGFGADLVAQRYRQLLTEKNGKGYIATSCPAIVAFVERYHPDLVGQLAPIVSPMVASARILRHIHGPDLKVVFIGPCIAKKEEATSPNIPDEIDAAITFIELRQMFTDAELTPKKVKDDDFDPPRAAAGGLFAISRGLLQAADIHEDLIAGEVVAAEGRTNFVEALREFEDGHLRARLLEILCCNGCIMGAGMSTSAPLFSRRNRVSRYVRERLSQTNQDDEPVNLTDFDSVDLSRRYTPRDQRLAVPFEAEISQIMARMGKRTPEDELNCGACGYDTCRDHAIAIFKGLAESEMCLPHTIDELRRTVQELAESHKELASAQEALMQSEKLASMGQLAAGIAHEVNNPLGVVLMYAHLLLEESEKTPAIREDLAMIADQADRCKRIVAGLLHFARQNKVVLQTVDVLDLVQRSLKAVHVPDNIQINLESSVDNPIAELDRDQIIQVLTNLVSNAVAAMESGGRLTIRIAGNGETIRLEVADNGSGISEENLPRIFDPFFTTKQIGKGTGLGLAVTYGIVKMHRGEIKVTSNSCSNKGPTGTTFTVILPRIGQQE